MIEQLYECFKHWSKKGSVWVYSDPHFNDEEAAGYGRISDEEQLKLINAKVGKNDTIVILGDVGDIEFARRIKGYKILICGNHDLGVSNYQRKIEYYKFDITKSSKDSVIRWAKETYPNCAIEVYTGYDVGHAPFEFWGVKVDNKLFDEVYTGPLFIGEKLLLSHEPINFPFALNLHGHCHKGQSDSHHINCCSNVVSYIPVSLKEICQSGLLKNIDSLHRTTIDDATKRKKKREEKRAKT